MSEQSLARFHYGYNRYTDSWIIYRYGESFASVDTEEYAILFTAAPDMAARIVELEAQKAAMMRALNVVMPWASKAVADKEDSVIGKRALDVAWDAIAKAKGMNDGRE